MVKSGKEFLDTQITSLNFIQDSLHSERLKGNTIFPINYNMYALRAITETTWPPRVVIIGQDPYASPIATGLAFGVRQEDNIPPSLQVIFKAFKNDYGDFDENKTKTLEHLPSQGVMLLNSALTIRGKEVNSHVRLWRPLITNLIIELNKVEEPIIFVLLGSIAKELEEFINIAKHHIIKMPHPAFEAYKKIKITETQPFSQKKLFKRIDNLISQNERHRKEKISWVFK